MVLGDKVKTTLASWCYIWSSCGSYADWRYIWALLEQALASIFFQEVTPLLHRKVHYATCPFAVASCGIIQLSYAEAFLISRFLIGMYCGILTACAAQHLKEIAPVKLRPLMSSLFSLGQILGCVICFTISTIFMETYVFFLELYVIFPISGGLAIVQCLLIGFLVPDSPV